MNFFRVKFKKYVNECVLFVPKHEFKQNKIKYIEKKKKKYYFAIECVYADSKHIQFLLN